MIKKKKLVFLTFVKSKQLRNSLLICMLFFGFHMYGSVPNLSAENDTTTIIIEKDMSISINQIFDLIQKQTSYKFIYRSEKFQDTPLVSVKKGSISIVQLLQKGLFPLNYDFEFTNDDTIIVKEKIVRAKKQKRTISGKILSKSTHEPLIGATIIFLEGEKTIAGTITDFEGDFKASILASITSLKVTMIGYETYTTPIGTTDVFNIEMAESTNVLNEVVISTGIFKRKAKSFTGAAVTIGKKELEKMGNVNVLQAIQNIDPSVIVFDNLEIGSDPNALPDIKIRGTSTFPGDQSELQSNLKGNYLRNPNQPLFILNGFETSVEQIFDLDINRIQSVTLLKDAASKAIYGSRAANGVVVIETIQLSTEKSLITYNGSINFEVPELSSYNLTNSFEKIEAERIDGMYIPTSLHNSADETIRLQQLYNFRRKLALEGLNTDWLSKPLQTGIGKRHSLSVELGGDDLRILANISYRDTEGVMKGSFRKNLAGSLTTYYRLDNVSFKNIMSVNTNMSEDSPYGDFQDYAAMNPYWRAEREDGTIPYYAEIGPTGIKYTNPLYNSQLNTNLSSSYFSFVNNFYLEWKITSELMATTRIGIDVKKSGADQFYPSGHTKFESLEFEPERKGSYQLNDGESSNFSGDLNLNYIKTNGKHFYFANLGMQVSENKYNEVVHIVEGFPSNLMDNIIFGRGYALDSRPTGIDGISRDLGFLAVGSYVFDERFLSDVTLRTNASSQFGKENRWANFWSVGLGWNIHNEKFLKNSLFEQLKLRGSIGSTGNQNFNSNASIATYAYYLDSQYQGFTGSYLQNMVNSSLQWETKLDKNIGLDLRIKRVSMRLDYYESLTENLITSITIPTSTGFNSVKDNLGKVENTGIEANISFLVYAKDRNFFSVQASIATNNNKIIALSEGMKSFNEAVDTQAANKGNDKPLHKYEDGMSMDAIWAVPSLGIDPSTGNEIYVTRDGSTTYEWNAADMVVAGNYNPKFSGNFGFTGEYKGFGANVIFRYLGGGQMYNSTLVNKVENVDMNYNVDRRVLTGRWLEPGQEALFKRLGTYDVDLDGDSIYESLAEKTRPTSRFVQDRNELSLATVNIYYDFNKKFANKLGLERLKLGFNTNEVVKFSSIKIERGTSYPFTRTMSFTVSATL